MTAGTEVVCNDVVRKVEIEEKCIAVLDASDLNEVGDVATVHDNLGDVATVHDNVGDNGNSNVSWHVKDDTDDSSYVFVNGIIEKEELGIENGSISVDPLVLETNGIVNGSATVEDPDLKAVTEEVNLKNGSTVDPLVLLETNGIAHDVNGHLDQITEEEEQVVKSTDEVDEANGITSVEAKTDDTASGITVDLESTLNPTESSQVTVFESESTFGTSLMVIVCRGKKLSIQFGAPKSFHSIWSF